MRNENTEGIIGEDVKQRERGVLHVRGAQMH